MKLLTLLTTAILLSFAFTACSTCPMMKKKGATCCSTGGSCTAR